MKTFSRTWLAISMIAIGIGIALLILALGTGGASLKNIETYSKNETYDGVKSLDFDISYGRVEIEEGDVFSIDAQNLVKNGLESYVSDGTWVIKENKKDYIDLFGIKFTAQQLAHWNNYLEPVITITVPSDFVAENTNLSIGAGSLEADAIHSAKGYFSVGAGELRISRLAITDSSDYQIGAGQMIIDDIQAKDITVDCSVGNVQMSGVITGDNDISCGVGKVELDISGNRSDYSYEVNAGIGNVVIDNQSYHSISKKEVINSNAQNNLDMDCGIGNITVDFN